MTAITKALDAARALAVELDSDVEVCVRRDGRAEIATVDPKNGAYWSVRKFYRDEGGKWAEMPGRVYGRNYAVNSPEGAE